MEPVNPSVKDYIKESHPTYPLKDLLALDVEAAGWIGRIEPNYNGFREYLYELLELLEERNHLIEAMAQLRKQALSED